jgi:hypothetical protein
LYTLEGEVLTKLGIQLFSFGNTRFPLSQNCTARSATPLHVYYVCPPGLQTIGFTYYEDIERVAKSYDNERKTNFMDRVAENKNMLDLRFHGGEYEDSQRLLNFYQTTQRNNPEDSHLQCFLFFLDSKAFGIEIIQSFKCMKSLMCLRHTGL